MTIVVGVAAPDGIILAADSRTTTCDEHGRWRIVSDSAVKLFDVCGCAVATYGLAFINEQTVAGLLDELEAELNYDQGLGAANLAARLGDFFQDRFSEAFPEFDPATGAALGFIVGGYDADGIGHLVEVTVPGPAVMEHFTTATYGAVTRGEWDVFDRLYSGVDWARLTALDVNIEESLQEQLGSLRYELLFPITLQDAIDYAMFIIRTTIDAQRFTDGTVSHPKTFPTCGGPIRVLSITKWGTRWVADAPLAVRVAANPAEGEDR